MKSDSDLFGTSLTSPTEQAEKSDAELFGRDLADTVVSKASSRASWMEAGPTPPLVPPPLIENSISGTDSPDSLDADESLSSTAMDDQMSHRAGVCNGADVL